MAALKKLACDCDKCKTWNEVDMVICEKMECACEDYVSLSQRGDGLKSTRYTCADKNYISEDAGGYFCGFDVDAYNADVSKYLAIMTGVKEYIFYMLYRDRCVCGLQTKAVLKRISYTTPSYLRGPCAKSELQLFYVCSKDVCDVEQSVPEIVAKRHLIKCLCGRRCVYEYGVYSCPKVGGGCGVCFHEMDSLTFMHTWIVNKKKPLTLYPPRICHLRGVIKYIFNEISMQGQLFYKCRAASDCLLVKDMNAKDCVNTVNVYL